MTADDLNARLASLGQRYLQRTATETPVLREWLDKVAADPARALKEMEVLAHRIHGSGAMFGFGALSDAAGAVERLAERGAASYSENYAENPAALIAQLNSLLDALDAALHAALQP